MNNGNKKRESIALKPCPFCGSKKTKKETIVGIDGKLWWATCTKCGSATGLKSQAIEAVAAWNLRVSEGTDA
jgi:Lar family restriction alleviation protein